MTRLVRSEEELSLEEVSAYYNDSLEALRLLKQNLLDGVPPVPSQFIGLTSREVEEIFTAREQELDRLATFNLLAATEASLRIDFDQRANKGKRGRGDLDSRFYQLYRDKKEKISLEDHIIAEWKEAMPEVQHVFSNFKSLQTYRNWLAHGRYWIPNLSRKRNDFHSLYPICFAVEEVLRQNR